MLHRIGFLLSTALVMLPSAGIAGWSDDFWVSLRFEAVQDGEPHPGSRTLYLVLSEDYPLGLEYCLSYGASSREGGPNGRIRARVEVDPVDPERQPVPPLGFGRRVKRGFSIVCSASEEPVQAGDLLVVTIFFRKFPPLDRGEGFRTTLSTRGLAGP